MLGKGAGGIVEFADISFDKVQRISADDLKIIDDGFVAFTDDSCTVAAAQQILGRRRLPMLKLGQWSSIESFDAEWLANPSQRQLKDVLKLVYPVTRHVDVQRFLPYATVSFFCLAVVAIWYAVYSSEIELDSQPLATAAEPLIIEPLPSLEGANPASTITVKSMWVVPAKDVVAPTDGRLVWLAESFSRINSSSRIALINLQSDKRLQNTALAFQQQAIAVANQRQNKFDASYKVQLLQINDEISQTEKQIASCENELDQKSAALAIVVNEARRGARSWTELKPFEHDIANLERLRQGLKSQVAELRSSKDNLLDGDIDFRKDSLYLALLENAKKFVELVVQSPAKLEVFASQKGTIEHVVTSQTLVRRGDKLAVIKDIDGSHFICSMSDKKHSDQYRNGDIFLILANGEKYLLDLHSETWAQGVYEYKLKMDVLRHSELFRDLNTIEQYDIVFQPR